MARKVLFLITKGNFGGAQKYVYDLAMGLKKDQFEPLVALGEGRFLEEKLQEKGIRTIKVGGLKRDISLLNDLKSFIELLKIFKNEKPDVVHLNSSKAGGLGAMAARLAGIERIVFTAHGFAFNENRSWSQKFLIKTLAWLTILFSHKTIAVSQAIKDRVSNWPFVWKKVEVIRNGVGEIHFKTKEGARSFLYQDAPKNATWIGTISELHHIKGLGYAIRAIKSVSQTHKIVFVVMGDGEEKEKLKNLVKNEELEEVVKFAGFVDNAPQYLKAFDIFTLTSLSEAFPLSLLEAGRAELPIVASNVGGIPEIIEDKKTGLLVESKNIIAIYKAINHLVENRKKRDILAKNLNKKVETDFSFDNTIKKTKEIYEAIT